MAQMSATDKIDVSIEHKKADPDEGDAKKHPNTCPGCGSHYRDDELRTHLRVCPQCGHHFPVRGRERIEQLADGGTFVEDETSLRSGDPLDFFDLRPYTERLAEAEVSTGLGDAMITGTSLIEGHPCRLAVMDFSFMGGSMGSVVGEKFARACEHAVSDGLPLVSVSSSGGARMQEGILALMQLPKTICALEELHDSGGVMLSVITHPTTGGLLASFASLGDVIIAEPGALMSFAGPRVVAQTTREKLPGRLRAVRVEPPLRAHRRDRPALGAPADVGAADAPVREARVTTDAELGLRDRLAKLSGVKLLRGTRLSAELERLQRQLERLQEDTSDEEIWRRVELARHQERPYTLDYVERILDDFFELHGDRGRMDDHAIVTGIGKLEGRTIALIGHQKGRDLKERTSRNFGMAYPEGYRKAMRVMELADRHRFPLVTLVDTPGAYPGVAAEQHGQGGAIARSQAVMARLGVPTVVGRDRRGRLRRRRRDRGRRPRADAGELDLLGHLARGLRRDPLAGRLAGEEGGVGVPARCRPLPRPRRDRGDRPGARGWRPGGPRRGRAPAARVRRRRTSPSSTGSTRWSCAAPRRAKFRAMGVFA